ncbi:MAG: DUF3817 domain-containing protein [Bacteroidetes bacterium]|nr:DUF3817 domain-containing protein [Fibrella sp.]
MTDTLFNSLKIRLRAIGLAEGISYLVLLFIGVPLKRFGGHSEVVEIVGPIHGLLFLLYVLIVVQAKVEYNWPLGKTLLALVASVIPGGTFYADHKIFRHLPGRVTPQ